VIAVAPPDGANGACPNTIVTATFSEAMNPSSIDGTTFTLTGPGAAPVAGQVTYDAVHRESGIQVQLLPRWYFSQQVTVLIGGSRWQSENTTPNRGAHFFLPKF
jgi:hypothetical protein